MKIGFIFDTQKDYKINDNMIYADFCQVEEAEFICRTLRKLGHQVCIIGSIKDFLADQNKYTYDLIFNKCEGFNSRNREGIAPACLEAYGIPYVGTDAYGLSLSLNKFHTKLIAKYLGVETPKFEVIRSVKDVKNVKLEYPFIVKPNNEGSSMGVVIVDGDAELYDTVDRLLKIYGQEIMCEEYIQGDEISVPIIGVGADAEVLGITEFRPLNGERFKIYSTDDKYITGCRSFIYDCPAELRSKIIKNSLLMYREMGLMDYGRVDFRIKNDVPYFLEVNPLPTLEEGTSFVICSEANGRTFEETLDKIIKYSLCKGIK